MKRVLVLVASLATVAAGGCVDWDAGPDLYTGRAAIIVGVDLVGRRMPSSPINVLTTGNEPVNVIGLLAGGATDSMVLTIGNLPVLASGGSYQVWLADSVSRNVRRINAAFQIQRPDTIRIDPITEVAIINWVAEAPVQNVESFNAQSGKRTRLVVRAAHVTAAGSTLRDFTHVVVTISTGGDASPLNSPAPAFFRYRNGANNTFVGVTTATATPVRPFFNHYPGRFSDSWVPLGGGTVEFLNTEGFGMVVDRNTRPPLGFYYDVWLVDNNPRGRAPVHVGEATSPAPRFLSLKDADISTIPGVVTQTQILELAIWQKWGDLRDNDGSPLQLFKTVTLPGGITTTQPVFTHVVVALRSKHAVDGLPPTVVYEARIPDGLDRMPVEKEPRIRDS
jgi:hypothetical protein